MPKIEICGYNYGNNDWVWIHYPDEDHTNVVNGMISIYFYSYNGEPVFDWINIDEIEYMGCPPM